MMVYLMAAGWAAEFIGRWRLRRAERQLVRVLGGHRG